MRRSGSPPAHQPMVEAEEVEPLAPFDQVHDAGLGRLGLQPKLGQQVTQPPKGGFGLLPGGAQHQRVVGVADQHAMLTRLPCPVQPVQVDVGEQRGDHPTLWRASHAAPQRPALHHPGAQQRAHQTEHGPVADAFLDRLHQPGVRNRLKTVGDIRLHHPAAAPPGLVNEHLQGIVRRPPRAKPKGAVQHVGFEDRLEHDPHRRLHDPVTHRGNRQRPLLTATRLGDEHPPGRQRYRRSLSSAANSSRSRPTPYSSTSASVMWSMPAAPRLRRTPSHARSNTSLR